MKSNESECEDIRVKNLIDDDVDWQQQRQQKIITKILHRRSIELRTKTPGEGKR